MKACVCKNPSSCAAIVAKWTALNDSLRCGYYRIPRYDPKGDEHCLDNKIRRVIFYYMYGDERSEKIPTPDSIQSFQDQYVAYHHFSPLVLQICNGGPVMFMSKELAQEIKLDNARTVLFSLSEKDCAKYDSQDVAVGKYICAPNYSWWNIQTDIVKMNSAITKYLKKPRIASDTNAVEKTLINLIMDRDWKHAYERCNACPDEAKQWLVSTSSKTGSVFLRKLPLHFACRFSAPKYIIAALVDAYPKGLEELDESGKLPIHTLFNLCHKTREDKKQLLEIVEYMLEKYPESSNIADMKGMLPIHRASSTEVGDDVVNKLFIANQRGVMTRDAKGRLPKNLINRAYKRQRIRARIAARRREEAEVAAIAALKSEKAKAEEVKIPPINTECVMTLVDVNEETKNDQHSSDHRSEFSVESVKLNSGLSTSDYVKEIEVKQEPKNLKLKKKVVRLNNRPRRSAYRSAPSKPIVIENFTCISKRSRKLKKEMKKYEKMMKSSMIDKTVESYTCLSKKDRKLKKEMKRLQLLTEEALANSLEADTSETSSKSIQSIVSTKPMASTNSGGTQRRLRNRSKKVLEKTKNEPVSIENYTCMSSKNRKLKKEMKRLQRLTEDAILRPNGIELVDEEIASRDSSQRTLQQFPIRSKSKGPRVRLAKKGRRSVKKPNDPILIDSYTSMSCKQNKQLMKEVNALQPKTIDQYTCTSGKRNKKLNKEMKKMQALMREELGQPKRQSKSKLKKLKKPLVSMLILAEMAALTLTAGG